MVEDQYSDVPWQNTGSLEPEIEPLVNPPLPPIPPMIPPIPAIPPPIPLTPPRNKKLTPMNINIQQPNVPNTITINSGSGSSIIASYLLWFFFGWAGIHHLYMGRGFGVWIISLITFQGFGFWWLADFFLIPSSSRKIRNQKVIVSQNIDQHQRYLKRF
jgi:TM2 domain-containing membrane protein YozV